MLLLLVVVCFLGLPFRPQSFSISNVVRQFVWERAFVVQAVKRAHMFCQLHQLGGCCEALPFCHAGTCFLWEKGSSRNGLL